MNILRIYSYIMCHFSWYDYRLLFKVLTKKQCFNLSTIYHRLIACDYDLLNLSIRYFIKNFINLFNHDFCYLNIQNFWDSKNFVYLKYTHLVLIDYIQKTYFKYTKFFDYSIKMQKYNQDFIKIWSLWIKLNFINGIFLPNFIQKSNFNLNIFKLKFMIKRKQIDFIIWKMFNFINFDYKYSSLFKLYLNQNYIYYEISLQFFDLFKYIYILFNKYINYL